MNATNGSKKRKYTFGHSMLFGALLTLLGAFTQGCGENDPSDLDNLRRELRMMDGQWATKITVQPVILDPSTPPPKPFEYTVAASAQVVDGDQVILSGLCPNSGETVTLAHSLERPFWRGTVSECASFPVLDCTPAIVALTEVSMWVVDDKTMGGEGAARVAVCGTEYGALIDFSASRIANAVAVSPAQHEASMLPPDEGCYPYCEGEEEDPEPYPTPPSSTSWAGTATATPVFLVRDPNAAQPSPVARAVQPSVSSTAIVGVCESVIPLSNGRFENQSGMQCWTNATLPAFYASDAPDQWTTCDGATVLLRSLDVYYRDSGRTVYMEGGATIVGCGRSWNTVLFQTTVTR